MNNKQIYQRALTNNFSCSWAAANEEIIQDKSVVVYTSHPQNEVENNLKALKLSRGGWTPPHRLKSNRELERGQGAVAFKAVLDPLLSKLPPNNIFYPEQLHTSDQTVNHMLLRGSQPGSSTGPSPNSRHVRC